MEQGKDSAKLDAIRAAAKARLDAMLAKSQQANAGLPTSHAIQQQTAQVPLTAPTVNPETMMITVGGNTFNPYELDGLILNEQQRKAVDLFGLQGKSGCLIGPAGTGKTTTMKALIRAAIMSGRVPILPTDMEHKYLAGGLPGIFGGSFTRIATRNLRDNCPADIQGNIHTIHRLLEFEPEMLTVWDEATKKEKKLRIFKPTRGTFRPLDPNLWLFLIDETSMVGVDLHNKLVNAVNPNAKAQFLYIGDIAQLPPVMDDAILGYKLIEHSQTDTVVELTQVYRHAGAIVNLATEIRTGQIIPRGKAIAPYAAKPHNIPLKVIGKFLTSEMGFKEEVDNRWSLEEDGSKVSIQIWKNRLDGEVGQLRALQNLGLGFFPKQMEAGLYNPMTDMILMPYNKAVGTIELNKYIADYLGRKRNEPVYEIIAGFNKIYLAVGDKVFYDREEAIVTKININALYSGRVPQAHSVTLNRWGHNTAGANVTEEGFDDIEALLNLDINDDERKNQASHVIHLKKIADDDGEDYKVSTAAEVNNLLFGYALTIHKSQGSQWKKVYTVFHNSHNRNLQRELLYTAITRAQKELYIIAEPETLVQGVLSQHIVGNTLQEKAEYFKGKVEANKKRNDLFNGEGK